MKSNRPIDKSEEVMHGLGKEPGRISVMIPVSKILNWFKRKKDSRLGESPEVTGQAGMTDKEGGQNNENTTDSWINRPLDI